MNPRVQSALAAVSRRRRSEADALRAEDPEVIQRVCPERRVSAHAAEEPEIAAGIRLCKIRSRAHYDIT